MNFMDAVFILALVGILLLGFFQGMVRMLVLILAFYLSALLATLYYPALGGFFYSRMGGQLEANFYIGFFVVLLITFGLLAWAGIFTFRYARLPGKLALLDHSLGMFLGLGLAALILGMLSVLFWNFFVVWGAETIDFPLFPMLGGSVRGSRIMNLFQDNILPSVYDTIRPFFPPGAEFIFTGSIRA